MHSEDSDFEALVIPIGDDKSIVVPAGDSDSPAPNKRPEISALFKTAGLLTTTALAGLSDLNAKNATIFEMSPDSYQKYKGARLDEVGGYFRAVLRTSQGKVSHQVQIREVQHAQAPAGLNIVAAAQMAAIQAQLDQIEDNIATLTDSVSKVLDFLSRQQGAEIVATVRVIRQVHDRASTTGAISDTDWARVAGLEHVLQTHLIAVRSELQSLLENHSFGDTPENDRKQMEAINPDRVTELAKSYWLLSGGFRDWSELLALRKYREEELTDEEATAILARIEELRVEQESILNSIGRVVAAKTAKERGLWNKLRTDGAYFGKKHDKENIEAIAAGRATLDDLGKNLTPTFTSSAPSRMLTAEEYGTTELGEANAELPACGDHWQPEDN